MNKEQLLDLLLWKETFLPVPCQCSLKFYDVLDCPHCRPKRSAMAKHCWQVFYVDKRGAGCMRTFNSESDLLAFVKKLKCDARIDRDGKRIGEVYRASGEVDDRRVKWLWNFEKTEDSDLQRCRRKISHEQR